MLVLRVIYLFKCVKQTNREQF